MRRATAASTGASVASRATNVSATSSALGARSTAVRVDDPDGSVATCGVGSYVTDERAARIRANRSSVDGSG